MRAGWRRSIGTQDEGTKEDKARGGVYGRTEEDISGRYAIPL